MEHALAFTPEQFTELLSALGKDGSKASGLGAAPSRSGLGTVTSPLDVSVYAMLQAGSPRLALAKAWGVPLAPYFINVRAVFPDTATTLVPDVGSDVKIVQDTIIDGMVVRIQNESATVNQNTFQAQSDFYFGFQSGIEAKLDVLGAPRYSVAPKFTPLSTLADVINGADKWPNGWILTYQQQLQMQFKANVALPMAPIEVICTFRAWLPVNETFVDMSNRDACAFLALEGYVVSDGYVKMMSAR